MYSSLKALYIRPAKQQFMQLHCNLLISGLLIINVMPAYENILSKT